MGKYVARRPFPWFAVGGWTIVASVLLAIGPMLVGIIVAPIACDSGADEGSCSWAAVPWLTFFTAPIGVLGILLGVALLIVGGVRRGRRSGRTTDA